MQNSDTLIPKDNPQWHRGFQAGWDHCSWRHDEAIEKYNLIQLAFCKFKAEMITQAGLIAEISSVFNNKKSN